LRPPEKRQLSFQNELAANLLFSEQVSRPAIRFAKRYFLAIGGFPSMLYLCGANVRWLLSPSDSRVSALDNTAFALKTRVLTVRQPVAARNANLRTGRFRSAGRTDADLAESNYGQYEGLRLDEILAFSPDWQLFRDGCRGSESPARVAERADSVVRRRPRSRRSVLSSPADTSSGFWRTAGLALGPVCVGKCWLRSTASLSASVMRTSFPSL
jgi:hypothetical protein